MEYNIIDNMYVCACGWRGKTMKGLKIHYSCCKTTNPNANDKSKEWSDEMRKTKSDEVKKQWQDNTYREKMSNALKAIWQDEEFKARASEKLKEVLSNEEIRRKMSDAATNRFSNEEERQKQSERLKSYNETHPEHKQVLSNNQKEVWKRPGFRENQIEKGKEIWVNQEKHIKQSDAIKKVWQDEEFLKVRMTETVAKQKETWKNKTSEEIEEISNKKQQKWLIKSDDELKEISDKRYNSKKQNNSFNTSKIETELKNYFDSNNILYITQYKNNLYPFCCDFYFPDKDLYVEIQGLWTHGGKPYISTDEDCIEQLELWKTKDTEFYNNAIETWTERDVKKRETAKANNLNWIEIFSDKFDECLKIILNNLK